MVDFAAHLAKAVAARQTKPPPASERCRAVTLGGLTFSSDFDSGSLGCVRQGDDEDSFTVFTRADCEGSAQP